MADRLEKLISRRRDPRVAIKATNEAYERIKDEPAIRYAIGAMQSIDPTYTQNTYQEGERVTEQLKKGLDAYPIPVTYRYQGSVTSDTHIRVYSDLDLLTIHTDFETIEPPNKPTHPYEGEPLDELSTLRNVSIEILRAAYPSATVDTSGPKAVSISGGSLRRKVDVVASNWWNTVEYVAGRGNDFRGIRVFDSQKRERINNKPFLHNRLIDDRDTAYSGNVRKLIRLLKSLKYDSDSAVDVSSFDIAAIVYNMPDELLHPAKGQELTLMNNLWGYMGYLLGNPGVRDALMIPNGMRKVFGPDGTSLTQFRALFDELDGLLAEIRSGLTRSFRKLEEARIAY